MTRVPVPSLEKRIRYNDKIMLIGSCFTEHIGSALKRFKYDVCINPFGIVYNPVSMAIALERIAALRDYTTDELVFRDGLYHSMDHHGQFSGRDGMMVAEKINKSLAAAHAFIQQAQYCFISPGTARLFIFKPSGHVVANCHKIPQDQFQHYRLTQAECGRAYQRIADALRQLKPDIQLIWTISPVRHLRDGLIENQRSKATLILALDERLKDHSSDVYFPAYEIMVDELRDYRYYARDMAHPSEVAIDIIRDRFVEACLDEHDRVHHPLIEQIRRAMEHRFLHDDRDNIKKFAAGQLRQIEVMASRLPQLSWQEERQYFFQLTEED